MLKVQRTASNGGQIRNRIYVTWTRHTILNKLLTKNIEIFIALYHDDKRCVNNFSLKIYILNRNKRILL